MTGNDFQLNETDALVVGASRGIGLALAETLALDTPGGSPPRRLFVTHRDSELAGALKGLANRASIDVIDIRCELTRDEDLETLQDSLATCNARLGLVLHAAGILHEPGLRPEKALAQARRESLLRMFEVNSIAPLLLARTVMSFVPKDARAHFAALSAMVGSIGDNRMGGWYGYRASKAALNQFMKTLAIEARRTHPGLCVTAIHPGTTDTNLSRPFQGGVPENKLYSPAQSAWRILEVVLQGDPGGSGRFVNWNGEPLPW